MGQGLKRSETGFALFDFEGKTLFYFLGTRLGLDVLAVVTSLLGVLWRVFIVGRWRTLLFFGALPFKLSLSLVFGNLF